jgi:hypothetical protein
MCCLSWLLQPKYIPEFIAKQAEADADIVTGSRYIAGGGVAGWDFRRKLTSCGANILAATLLQPRARTRLPFFLSLFCFSFHAAAHEQPHAMVTLPFFLRPRSCMSFLVC